MDEYLHQAMASHFVWGLGLGLFLVLLTWISGVSRNREARREVRRLREHLHTQMDITSKGNAVMQSENTTLKQQNENLRIAVKEAQTKPGRAEIRMLSVYDRAVRILNQNAPGFSPVWEKGDEGERTGTGCQRKRCRLDVAPGVPAVCLVGQRRKTERPVAASTFDDVSQGHPAGPVD